jgi:lysophospholipase L1-like esterase
MSLTVEKCLQAWTNSLLQMNAKADIVFFGDSLTYYGDFASGFPNKVVCNLGLRGDTIQGMIDRVEQVRVLQPQQVFLMAGINDVAHILSDEFERLYGRLLDAISQALPEATIIVQTMLPVNNQYFHISCNNNQICECNSMIIKIAEERKLMFIDVHALYVENGQLSFNETKDGLHIIQESYSKWMNLLRSEF